MVTSSGFCEMVMQQKLYREVSSRYNHDKKKMRITRTESKKQKPFKTFTIIDLELT